MNSLIFTQGQPMSNINIQICATRGTVHKTFLNRSKSAFCKYDACLENRITKDGYCSFIIDDQMYLLSQLMSLGTH